MELPQGLLPYVVEQEYEKYTVEDHNTWKKFYEGMELFWEQNKKYLPKNYLKNFQRFNFSKDKIVRIEEVNKVLSEIGWTAVCIDGYLPSKIYAEMHARNIIIFARDIRCGNHVSYSPMPDLLHDIFGHFPMLLDDIYRKHLIKWSKLLSIEEQSFYDKKIYDLKNEIAKTRKFNPEVSTKSLESEVEEIRKILAKDPSRFTLLAQYHMWTLEFGLVGMPDDFQIIGAGLLSSSEEMKRVIKNPPKILPLSERAAYYDFEISDIQPHLFLASKMEDFEFYLEKLYEVAIDQIDMPRFEALKA